MNTILEIHNKSTSRSKVGRKDGSLQHPRKVNPIPPIHYTWNRSIETSKMNTILEIRNHGRPSIIDWKEYPIKKQKENTIKSWQKVNSNLR